MPPFITYRILEDRDGKLESAARLACNFWNHHIEPETPVVLHVDLYFSLFRTVAKSLEPEHRGGVAHGHIRFNTVYVDRYTELQLAGTLAHELGHTLGIGWARWDDLYDADTGRFTDDAIARLPALATMQVETGYGPATRYMHWKESRHRGELMTGIENQTEHVLPVTIDVMALLGHRVVRPLQERTPVRTLLAQLQDLPFTRRQEARELAAVELAPRRVLEWIFDPLPAPAAPKRPPPRPRRLHKSKRA